MFELTMSDILEKIPMIVLLCLACGAGVAGVFNDPPKPVSQLNTCCDNRECSRGREAASQCAYRAADEDDCRVNRETFVDSVHVFLILPVQVGWASCPSRNRPLRRLHWVYSEPRARKIKFNIFSGLWKMRWLRRSSRWYF